MKKIVAIDGPAASGKTVVAHRVAQEIKFRHISSGDIYRAIAYYGINVLGSDFPNQMNVIAKHLTDNPHSLQLSWEINKFTIYLMGKEVEKKLRSELLTTIIGKVASYHPFRNIANRCLIKAGNIYNLVIDGRDIGTLVFPDAWCKFFLTASAEERARRRSKDMGIAPESSKFQRVLSDLNLRDERDKNRKIAPLIPADDAILIDTTDLSLDEAVATLLAKLPQDQAVTS